MTRKRDGEILDDGSLRSFENNDGGWDRFDGGCIRIEWNSSRNLAAWFTTDRGFATSQMISVGANARDNGFPEGLKLIIERCSY
ncbi:hypothetical protein ANTPLA_LOCUS7013 [Anthophora plagiata]